MYESTNYQYFEDVNWGLLRLWGDRKSLDVLDVGCGFATTSQHIVERGNRVTGIESSAEAVAIARQRASRVCVYATRATLSRPALPKNSSSLPDEAPAAPSTRSSAAAYVAKSPRACATRQRKTAVPISP